MCGICGFTGEKNNAVLTSMANAIRHRGPDEDGYYADGKVNLAIRRLSIVDLETGQQPISNEDGTIWVIFNGEIYNHVELRSQLESKRHSFKTDHSDTEVIVHLYEEYGEDWPIHVNGMFGVALWDNREEKLLLYRDRIGKKPLYYAFKNHQIVFGSEIKAILKHPLISRDLDCRALYHYFGLKNISAPATAYADIRQLLPGHFLVWHQGKTWVQPYWKLDFSHPLTDVSEEEAAQYLLQLLEDAVKLRMQCDVQYGAYLSGGVDSSSVVAMMRKHQSKPVVTFCLGYEDEPQGQFFGKAQDIAYARQMAERLGTEHYEYIIDAKQFADHMPDVLSAFDEPFSGTISTFFLSILMKKHVKVALSGDGADELFGSYLAHRLAFPIQSYLLLKDRGKTEWDDLEKHDMESIRPFDSPDQFRFLKSIASRDLAAWRGKLAVFSNGERSQLLTREFLHASGYPEIEDAYQALEGKLTAKDVLNKSLEMDQMELLPNQVLPFVDRLSMAHSIEVRVPYLDYRIVEFSNRLPGNLKIKNGIVKYIHKKAMERLLPIDLVQRPKEGFVQPIYSWIHGELKGWVEERLDSLDAEIFNLEYVKTLKGTFQSGDQAVNSKVWNLVCFGLWYESTQL
jgi:asparagine synthase (glutamine-hydrolysing)